jgi:hypothetical protein
MLPTEWPRISTDDSGTCSTEADEYEEQVRLLRDTFSNSFRPLPPINAAWLDWSDHTIPQHAAAASAEGFLPDGHLDHTRLAVLADALQEAVCTDAELLGHLREPGPHDRGCWVVDLLLRRSEASRRPSCAPVVYALE